MDQREKLFRQKYDALVPTEREMLLRTLAEEHRRFCLLRFERFERFGVVTETAVYTCEGREFVFVPGDAVTLGWDSFADGMDGDTRAELTDALAEFEITDCDAFLKESMSPVRRASLPPLLVEHEVNAIGWHSVPLNSPELEPFWADIQKHFDAATESFEISGKMRVSRKDGAVVAEMYSPIPLDDFLAQIHMAGFSLPTEDEWEYLCGGGKRTLFRWGDSFNFLMKLRYFDTGQPDDEPYALELPNGFGLVIAHDPYRQEVVENSEYFLKGGDGGCNLCGGSGMVLGYLPVATFFRSERLGDDALRYREDIGGDYTFFRRIIRL